MRVVDWNRGGAWMLDVPLMLMLSPRWASERMSAQSLIVREVPPPPEEVASCVSRAETAGWR